MRLMTRILLLFFMLLAFPVTQAQDSDPLPSWNTGAAKQAIIDFVSRVTREDGPEFVPPAKRIATFDNDGTLWVEYPVYTQLAFALDRIELLAPKHPEWKTSQPFKAALEGDMKTLAEGGEKALLELVMVSHAGMSTSAFERIVRDWIATAEHPRFQRRYTQLVYQPMLELMSYLRDHGFKTYIVSGGGIGFMRPWSEETYGIPPEQVIGSRIVTKYEVRNGRPELVRLPEIAFINDKADKVIGIHLHIGRRPVIAFGNSDGDFQMLQWTMAGNGPRLAGIIHHTDCKREYCYDRKSPIGHLEKALDAAEAEDWLVVDMRGDWKVIFPAGSEPLRGGP